MSCTTGACCAGGCGAGTVVGLAAVDVAVAVVIGGC